MEEIVLVQDQEGPRGGRGGTGRRWAAMMIAICATALIAVGCGSSSDDSGSTSASTGATAATGSSTTAGGDDAVVAAAKTELAKVSGPKGQFGEPPASGPAPASGKNVWIVSIGQSVPAIAKTVATMETAAKGLGWTTKVWDGKLQPNEQLAGVRAAINAKADAIIVYGVDCPVITSGLQEAKAADIPVVAVEAFDCNDIKSGADPLFTWTVHYEQGTLTEFLTALGKQQANWAIAHGDGKTKVLDVRETDARTLTTLDDAFQAQMKTCPGCEIVDVVTFTGADYGPKLQQKVQQALLKNPDTDYVYAGADSTITGGVDAAIRASQKKPPAIGWECDQANTTDRETGIQAVCFDFVSEWEGYAAVDSLVRLFGGEKPDAQTGLGMRLVDAEHNSDGYQPGKGPVDFVAGYQKAWGQG
jgi:ribose transport system substrate-binding protein